MPRPLIRAAYRTLLANEAPRTVVSRRFGEPAKLASATNCAAAERPCDAQLARVRTPQRDARWRAAQAARVVMDVICDFSESTKHGQSRASRWQLSRLGTGQRDTVDAPQTASKSRSPHADTVLHPIAHSRTGPRSMVSTKSHAGRFDIRSSAVNRTKLRDGAYQEHEVKTPEARRRTPHP